MRQKPPSTRDIQQWAIEQLGVLAVAMRETITAECLQIYAMDLSDLSREQLEIALTRARRELRFFPKIAELRELAGTKPSDTSKIAAEAAWTFAMEYLRRWGVDRLPLWSSGRQISAPPLPPRIVYALRRIGGLSGLNQVTEESRPFAFKDFCEAYDLAPIANSLEPQLAETFCHRKLFGKVKELASAPPRVSEIKAPQVRPIPAVKGFPEPTGSAQDRREMLRQQAATLRSKGSQPA
jgi:hypothetical protein